MALTGQLSDMSLAELIEFFCNQRKTGRLKVDYHRGHGVFFIKDGELVDAKVGQLSGAEAVYFALTLPNAAFDFSPEVPHTRRTIEQAWTQVVLEGLRRLDEGLSPSESDAFGGWSPSESEMALFMDQVERLGEADKKEQKRQQEAAPLSMMVEGAGDEGGGRKKFMIAGAAAACVVLAVVFAAIPLMRGGGGKAASGEKAEQAAPQQSVQASQPAEAAPAPEATAPDAVPAEAAATDEATAQAQREAREREQRLREQRERARRAEELAKKDEAAGAAGATTPAATAPSGPKTVRVQINYDESGRVTSAAVAGASPGAEAFAGTAVRIARGRRFPAGKAGATVVTIPVN